jgi:hypothetical protein|tara:strand:- start:96 stop:686 length:591 start_codon:yes stop_codon:yes gene_type:complete
MKTINIHGKQYVEVKERVKYFREHFKDWALTSEILELTDTRCVIKSTVLNDKDRVIATGIAYEILGSSHINKTSFVENCETSSNGRALANLGIMIETSIASADEIQYAKAQETKPKTEKLTDDKFSAMIVAIGEGKGDTVKDRMKNYKLTKKQQAKLDELLSDKKDEKSNCVFDVIDELNAIEIPKEIKNSNNQNK